MTNNQSILTQEPQTTLSINPHKFSLWIFMVNVIMLFAAFTSAYIVKQGEGNWFEFELPYTFIVSTVIVLLSSGSLHWAYRSAKKDNLSGLYIGMSITVILGLAFLASQYWSWVLFVENNVHFVGPPSGSFVYVLMGVHGVHLISGVLVLLYMYRKVAKKLVSSTNMNSMDMAVTYWHFLGLLWVYLHVFLVLNN
ncbi:cytochrome c oxidase subunit 3 [Aureibacter tunicatorum]|uniref:Cytochrome c oxidase subunit 3 n=1 Tax=Aureibacter tunicatorum TaxID=866807 RepID=A0AAE3XM62_9BACT|nr:cytochrome c oxidase subunit 3 [Aureibacter tunicatorum]MDR6238987.1 cytochrome c oxidase subunit 3 [Aureibacter tunicatorum]BDD05087.1 cytochrome oxidase subunit III [Aureibacter tunicatorum]